MTLDWGPWATGIDINERMAQCRVMAALVHIFARPKGMALEASLHAAAAGNEEALRDAAERFRALPPAMARHVIAAFAAATMAAKRAC